MTFRTKLPLQLNQMYFLVKDFIESLFIKFEVIINSNAIIYSVRIMIVLLALVLAYMHTPNSKTEVREQQTIPFFQEIPR